MGNFLGHKSDIADGSLRAWEMRTFNNIVGDYYVAPRWVCRLDAGAVGGWAVRRCGGWLGCALAR